MSLTNWLSRLEAVIARLEDIADAFESSANTRSCAGPSRDLSAILGTVPSLIVEQSSNAGTSQAIAHSPEDLPTHIREFDVFLERSVGRYVALSNELGGAVATQASKVLASFQEQRKILVIALTTQKPDATKWKEMIQPMVDATAEVVEIQETTDHSDSMHNHLSCVADGIPVMAWIGIEMRAFNHVNKFLGYAQYFGNKVTKNYKDK